MRYSRLYHTILDGNFFFDLRRIDARVALVAKFLEHRAEGDDENLSERTPITCSIFTAQNIEMKSSSFSDAPKGSVAVINLHGDMIKYGTACSYGADEIAAKIREAAHCENICATVLDIDSGGGAVDAIPVLVAAINESRAGGTPVVANCDLCASAAYYTAIYCDEILAANTLSAEFGSIGVMTCFMDYQKYYEDMGIKVHTIYSDLSNYKNAAFEAARQGKYELLKNETLNPLAKKFQKDVKEQRKNLDTKVEGILNGRTFFAEEALKHGLIDGIGGMNVAIEHARKLSASYKLKAYAESFTPIQQ